MSTTRILTWDFLNLLTQYNTHLFLFEETNNVGGEVQVIGWSLILVSNICMQSHGSTFNHIWCFVWSAITVLNSAVSFYIKRPPHGRSRRRRLTGHFSQALAATPQVVVQKNNCMIGPAFSWEQRYLSIWEVPQITYCKNQSGGVAQIADRRSLGSTICSENELGG